MGSWIRTRGPPRRPNDLICRSLINAGFPAVNEPQSLFRADGKKPDGITRSPWRVGQSLVWDATVVDTHATSYLPTTATRAEAAAELAGHRNARPYQQQRPGFHCRHRTPHYTGHRRISRDQLPIPTTFVLPSKSLLPLSLLFHPHLVSSASRMQSSLFPIACFDQLAHPNESAYAFRQLRIRWPVYPIRYGRSSFYSPR